MKKTIIRVARIEDADKLLEIYAPYVLHTAISFEYDVPTVEEFQQRMRTILSKYPYLVAEREGEIVGYAYAGPFKTRAAYDWAVETTIYIQKDKKKTGIGKELYQALEQALALQNILNLNACIGYPETEDEYLNKNSVQFHKHLGYRFVGEFYQCGYKFNRWYNMVWMEKQIGVHKEVPLAVKRFDEIRGELEECYGIK
ncbi:MAG: GNAT family N-acetyltransferase [bacterium]|nr:GNAT family N-acetyltransferase [bacterium]